MGKFTLVGRQSFERDPLALSRDVADPHRQAEWNTLYERVAAPNPFVVENGARFQGFFRGFGAVEVRFEKVSDSAFTHVAPLRLLGVRLGMFRHTYAVSSEANAANAVLTQTVHVSTTGAGRLLTRAFKHAFEVRMPESFEELRRYINRETARAATA